MNINSVQLGLMQDAIEHDGIFQDFAPPCYMREIEPLVTVGYFKEIEKPTWLGGRYAITLLGRLKVKQVEPPMGEW